MSVYIHAYVGAVSDLVLQEKKKVTNDIVINYQDLFTIEVPKGTELRFYYNYTDQEYWVRYHSILASIDERDLRKKIIKVDEIIHLNDNKHVSILEIFWFDLMLLSTVINEKKVYFSDKIVVMNNKKIYVFHGDYFIRGNKVFIH